MIEKKIKLKNGKTIIFEVDSDNEMGLELIESFNKSINSLGDNIEDINEKDYWRTVIETEVGNRNATYIIDQIIANIVTPIEYSILESRSYPTDFYNIIKYICSEISKGRIDDWNSTDNLRLRTAEVFISLLQKQIYSAYNEYSAKLLGGDKEAKLYINPTTVMSEILTSQNVQQLENINPIEELSMMMRVTPIGIGGITKSEAWPKNAMNIHPSYYGNIDPLETPDSENIGILQHLTVGAAITNNRGLFAKRDRKDIKPLEVLGIAPSLIPFVDKNEGIRVTMASAQSKQAIPLLNVEVPAVQSGMESIYTPLLSEAFIKKSEVDGVVTEVTERHILVRATNNKIHSIPVTPYLVRSGMGKHGLSVFTPKVSVGNKVKKNQIIAEGSNIKDGIISNGVNLLTAWMPWKGYNFEDGMVVSESAAKKLTSIHLETQQVYLDEDQDVSFIADVNKFIKKGDILITYSTSIYDIETLNHLRADGGMLVDIEIYSNIEEENIPESLKPAYETFKDSYSKLHGRYPVGHFKEKGKKFKGILIKFIIQQRLILTIADKLNNRHFNKGVCNSFDTKVLCRSGWKYFYELDKNDEVMYIKDMNTFKAGFTKPIAYHEYDYSGEMYGYKSNYGVDYLVTPDHRLYGKINNNKNYDFEIAEKIHNNPACFKTNVNFDFDKHDPNEIYEICRYISPNKKETWSFNMTDYYELFAWFATEGCTYSNKTNRHKTIITQSTTSNPDNVEQIHKLLQRMNITYCRSEKSNSNFVISDRTIYEHFQPFGKCYDKYIPDWMFNTSKENLEVLFNTIIKGNGSTLRSGVYNFFSTSKRLIEDVHRLSTILGYRVGSIREENKNRKNTKYTINIDTNKLNISKYNLDPSSYYKEEYNNKVYCLTVPNGLIFTKRNGFAFWSGNCAAIVPDSEMPRCPWGEHVEIIYPPTSVINRINPGQLFELHTSLIARHLAIIMSQKTQEQFVSTLSKVIGHLDMTEGKVYTKNLTTALKAMPKGTYGKLVTEVTNNRFFPIIVPPFKTPDIDHILNAMNVLGLKTRYPLFIPEFNKTTEPIAVGYTYVVKLEHLSDKKLHARSTGPYTSTLLTPSHGKKRDGGQQIGEYDAYSLLAWDCPIVLDEFFGSLSSDHKTKNEIIAEIIQTGEGSFKASKSNPVKDLFNAYMLAIHLQSE